VITSGLSKQNKGPSLSDSQLKIAFRLKIFFILRAALQVRVQRSLRCTNELTVIITQESNVFVSMIGPPTLIYRENQQLTALDLESNGY
jgi:hypothetical protein